MTKLKIILIIFGIIGVLLIIYFVSHKKENISLELGFYKDDVSPVYCLPWDAIPELHESMHKLINSYTRNLPTGDLYYLHDKIPEFKMRFNDASNDLISKKKYYTTVEENLRDHTGENSSRMILENKYPHRLSDGKWRLNELKNMNRSIRLNNKQISITGTFYYPPGGLKEWHTNRLSDNVPAWRFYFIYLTDPNTESYFCYKNPLTGKFHKMRDKHKTFNMFYLNDAQERLLWHSVKCIKGGRISFGLKLTPYDIPGLVERMNLKPQIL